MFYTIFFYNTLLLLLLLLAGMSERGGLSSTSHVNCFLDLCLTETHTGIMVESVY